jgi:hypothetical protein
VSLVRTLTFDRTTATVTVSDTLSCTEPTAFEVPVITYRDYTKDEKGLQFAFRKKEGLRTLGMTVEASGPVAFRHEVIENKPRPDVTRLGFAFTQPVTNATLSLVYTPNHKNQRSGALAASRNRSAVGVSACGAEHGDWEQARRHGGCIGGVLTHNSTSNSLSP